MTTASALGLAVAALIIIVAVVVRWRPSASALRLIRWARRASGARRKLVVVDGQAWPYLEWPAPSEDAPTILLIHGFAADKDMWLGYAASLRGKARVIAPDLPGFGEAVRDADGDYTPRRQADRVADFLDALGIQSAHVAGSSMGGYISAWLAIAHPARVLTLALMNAAGVEGSEPSEVQLEAENERNPLVVETDAELRELFQLIAHKRMRLPRFFRQHLLSGYRDHGALLDKIFWQLVEAHETDALIDRLGRVRQPTLVLWGDRDRVIDKSCGEAYAAHIPGAQLVVLKNVGHIPMFEAPGDTFKAHWALINRTG